MRGFLRFATTALVVMALIAAGMVIFFGDTPTPSQETVDTTADTESGVVPKSDSTTGRRAPSKLVGETAVAVPDTMPASLAGTSVPGGWAETDANGSLVPTPQLRQLFEYYLAALGEETLPQLVARIEQALARLEEPARSEALDTLGDYLDYKLALGDLEATYGVVSNNYVRGGGDGYDIFASNAVDAYDFGPNLESVVAEYLQANAPYKPYLDGRISQ